MAANDNVINHTQQLETSHFQYVKHRAIQWGMDTNEIFRRKLTEARLARGMSAAELSRRAGLNVRAVKDIEEGRAQSPKISTAFALAEALDLDAGELMGLGPRVSLRAELVDFLAQYDADEQERLLAALAAIRPQRP